MNKFLNQIRLSASPNRHPNTFVVVICLVTFLAWFNVLSYKYFHFGYYDWDLALYANTMWNLTNGSITPSLFGTTFLANHGNYIAFFLTPLYAIFPYPLTLVALKILSFVVAGFLLYKIAHRYLENTCASLLIMVFYFLHPANIFMMLHEFDFESLALGPLVLMFYFFSRQKFIPFLLTALFVSLIKENTPLIVLAFGVYLLFAAQEKRWTWGGGLILLGAGIFYIVMFVLTPFFRQDIAVSQSGYWGMYSALGNSPLEIFKNFFLNPARMVGILGTQENINYLRDLFGPVGLLSLFSPAVLMVTLPILFQNLFSSVFTMQTIYFHYHGSIMPFIFLAAVFTLARVKKNFRKVTFHGILLLISVATLTHLYAFSGRLQQKAADWRDRLDPIRWDMVDAIPKEAAVIATFDFLNELSSREKLFPFYTIYRGKNVFTSKSIVETIPKTDYALIDFNDPWIYNEENYDAIKIHTNIRDFFAQGTWSIEKAVENLVLFKNNPANPFQLITAGPVENFGAEVNGEDGFFIDDAFQFLGAAFALEDFRDYQLLHLTFRWQSERPIPQRYSVEISLKKDNKFYGTTSHQIGYTIYPTILWKKGEVLEEHFSYLIPRVEPGTYAILLSFFNSTYVGLSKIHSLQDGETISGNTVQVGLLHIR